MRLVSIEIGKRKERILLKLKSSIKRIGVPRTSIQTPTPD